MISSYSLRALQRFGCNLLFQLHLSDVPYLHKNVFLRIFSISLRVEDRDGVDLKLGISLAYKYAINIC